MDSRKRRRDRLINSIPRIYASQTTDSVIGKLLDAFAGVLTELDDHIERALMDRWVDLANGKTDDSDSSPLDLLGQGSDIWRESWKEEEDQEQREDTESSSVMASEPDPAREEDLERWEDTESYRRRIIATNTVLTEGLTTPRSILSLAVLSLGAELCPHLIRKKDTTIGRGMRLGTIARCRGCPGPPENTCKLHDEILLEAQLTDNPPTPCAVRHGPLTHGRSFLVRSNSIYSDLPVLTLYADEKKNTVPVYYPALQNRRTGEVILYAGTLAPGATLSIRPRLESADIDNFDSYNKVGHHPWRILAPNGKALLSGRNKAGESYVQDVSDRIYYLKGLAFDEARFASDDETRFAGDREEPLFAALQREIRTPKIRPGEEMWVYRGYTQYDIEAITGNNIDDPEYRDLLENAPQDDPSAGYVDVTLEWWTRPPATFRLKIPKTQTVRDAENRGVIKLLKQNVEIARAAGVNALIDLPEPTRRDRHSLSERFSGQVKAEWREKTATGEKALYIRSKVKRKEHQEVEDVFAIQGIFDVTRFGWTRLAP